MDSGFSHDYSFILTEILEKWKKWKLNLSAQNKWRFWRKKALGQFSRIISVSEVRVQKKITFPVLLLL